MGWGFLSERVYCGAELVVGCAGDLADDQLPAGDWRGLGEQIGGDFHRVHPPATGLGAI